MSSPPPAALVAFIVCAAVVFYRARRQSNRLEVEVEDMRQRVDQARAKLGTERKRAEWRGRRWRNFGGKWESSGT